MEKTEKIRQLEILTSFRFIAASWVFFDHFGKAILAPAAPFLTPILAHGRMAVTFFFILSGFVLVYSNTDGTALKRSALSFLTARFARIYPVYLFALFIPIFHKLWLVFREHGKVTYFFTLPSVLTLTQSWIPSIADAWNPPAWSLSVEAAFYLAFPWLVCFLLKRNSAKLMAWSVMLLLVSECLRGFVLQYDEKTAIFFPPLQISQFVFGMALGALFLRNKEPIYFSRMLLLLSPLVLYFLLSAYSLEKAPCILPLVSLMFGVVIYLAAGLSGRAIFFLQIPLFVLLGEASYAFYIIHMPLMIGFRHLAGLVSWFQCPEQSMFILFTGFFFCTFCAIYLHLTLEKSARKWILSRAAIGAKI